ncbi:MAG TPA: hypothetical protein PLS53_03585 [Thermoanaerobaculaceae bacterium]|nr:hypothetical protein [Thermoanaerobaculaceae bacterium]HPS77218.1 hypothetical protein [Thermoanaerobaculaceae bacterium]
MSLLLGIALLLAAPPEPSYLVERLVRVDGQTRRVTLFRDGNGVVVVRDAAGGEDLRHTEVGGLILGQIEQVVREVYPELAKFTSMGEGQGEGAVELRLAPPGETPMLLRLQDNVMPSSAMARLTATLNGLEERILAGKPPAEDLSDWEPIDGEQAEMGDGRIITVLETIGTAGGGVVVRIRFGDSPTSEFVELVDLRHRAVRRLPQEAR